MNNMHKIIFFSFYLILLLITLESTIMAHTINENELLKLEKVVFKTNNTEYSEKKFGEDLIFSLLYPDSKDNPTAWEGPLVIKKPKSNQKWRMNVGIIEAVYRVIGSDYIFTVSYSGSQTFLHVYDLRQCKKLLPIMIGDGLIEIRNNKIFITVLSPPVQSLIDRGDTPKDIIRRENFSIKSFGFDKNKNFVFFKDETITNNSNGKPSSPMGDSKSLTIPGAK